MDPNAIKVLPRSPHFHSRRLSRSETKRSSATSSSSSLSPRTAGSSSAYTHSISNKKLSISLSFHPHSKTPKFARSLLSLRTFLDIPSIFPFLNSNMFGVKKPHLRFSRHHSEDENKKTTGSNPFDDSDDTHHISAARRTSSETIQVTPDFRASLFDDDSVKKTPASYSSGSSARNKYKNDFRDSGGYDNQSVQELENYAVHKSEETTKTVNNCLKIAEDIREDASKTLVQLHHQGEQINRTHMVATEIDHDLSRGEKLLGNLGGMFSRTWKPKKNRDIVGPLMTRDDSFVRRSTHLQQRDKLGLNEAPNRRSQSRTPPPESADAYQRVEFEKAKQDDGLSELSDLLGDLKNMAVDMGNELERQNKALDPMEKDIDELNDRVKQSNRRTRRLLGK